MQKLILILTCIIILISQNVYAANIRADFRAMPFSSIDATYFDGTGGIVMFSGNSYARYNLAQRQFIGGTANINNFTGMPFTRIDAAFQDGRGGIVMFSGGSYARYNLAQQKFIGGTANISNFTGMPFSTIDAAYNAGNHIVMYSGNLFAKYSPPARKFIGGTTNISDFSGMPFTRIDAAFPDISTYQNPKIIMINKLVYELYDIRARRFDVTQAQLDAQAKLDAQAQLDAQAKLDVEKRLREFTEKQNEQKRIAAELQEKHNQAEKQPLPEQPILRTYEKPYSIIGPTKPIPRRGPHYTWSIESTVYPNTYIKFPNDTNINALFLYPIETKEDASNARFRLVNFDDEGNLFGIEFQPDYLLHYVRDDTLQVHLDDKTVDYQKKASFIPRYALDGGSGFTFESLYNPGFYLKTSSNYQIVFAQDDGSEQFAQDASYFIVPSIKIDDQSQTHSIDQSGHASTPAPTVNTNNDLNQAPAVQDLGIALIGFRVNHGQLIDGITPIYSQIKGNLQVSDQFEGNLIGGRGGKETILTKEGYVVTGFDIQRGSYFGRTEVIHMQVIWSRWGDMGIVPNSSISSEWLGSGKNAKITDPVQSYRATGNSFVSEIDATMSHRSTGEYFLHDMKISKTIAYFNN
ncbi:MAG: AbfB domain-containing protein [Halopseudomonas aestusnigri]